VTEQVVASQTSAAEYHCSKTFLERSLTHSKYSVDALTAFQT
jgi:hypothetical protein